MKELDENCQGTALAGRGGLLQREGKRGKERIGGTANTSEVDRGNGNGSGNNLRYYREIK